MVVYVNIMSVSDNILSPQDVWCMLASNHFSMSCQKKTFEIHSEWLLQKKCGLKTHLIPTQRQFHGVHLGVPLLQEAPYMLYYSYV